MNARFRVHTRDFVGTKTLIAYGRAGQMSIVSCESFTRNCMMMITCFNAWAERYVCGHSRGNLPRARLNYIHLMCEFSVFFGAPNHCPLSAAERHVCEEIYGNLHLTNDHTQWNIPRKSGTPAGGQLFTRMWERSALSAGQQWEFEMICLRNHRLCAWLLLISSDSQDQQPPMINF